MTGLFPFDMVVRELVSVVDGAIDTLFRRLLTTESPLGWYRRFASQERRAESVVSHSPSFGWVIKFQCRSSAT